jgi:hypothetical protein
MTEPVPKPKRVVKDTDIARSYYESALIWGVASAGLFTLPWLIFPGVLIDQIHATAHAVGTAMALVLAFLGTAKLLKAERLGGRTAGVVTVACAAALWIMALIAYSFLLWAMIQRAIGHNWTEF